MFQYMPFSEDLVRLRVEELLQEASKERLAHQVTRRDRPVRGGIAEWLVAIAVRIEGRPRASVVRAEA